MRKQLLFQRLRTLLLCLLCFSVPFGTAGAEAAASAAPQPSATEVNTKIGGNTIQYPQLTGLADTTVQGTINDAIVEKTKIAQRMVTLSTLKSGGSGLTVSDENYLGAGIFSTVISAYGILENGRQGQEYTALSFDLATGRALTLADLFSDPDAAVSALEETIENTVGNDLSDYLVNASLTPLPKDNFTLDADGITFYYPAQQFSLLSGYSGAVQFNYDELTDFLITDATALPARLNALPQTYTDEQIKALIIQDATEGKLPHLRAKIGDSMADLVSQYRLVRQPDQYPGGRYFQLEAPIFRQVLVLSDALTNGYENSKALGIMSFRADLYGLKTGVTTRSRWQEVLGKPDTSVTFDEDLAYDYGLPTGTADYYAFGGRQLLLYADENNLLFAVRLTD